MIVLLVACRPAVVHHPVAPPTVDIRVDGDTIAVTPPPVFEADGNLLLPAGVAVVDAVADHLNRHAEIETAVIDFHTSAIVDGRGVRLDEARSRAIYERLLEVGVPKPRLAYLGCGECGPFPLEVRAGLHLHVRWFEPGEAITRACSEQIVDRCYEPRTRLPWSGEWIDVVIPTVSDPR